MFDAAPQLRLIRTGHAAPLPVGAQRELPRRRRPLGEILVGMKAVSAKDMARALALQNRREARLGDILLAHGWVTEPDLMAALSAQWGTRRIDLAAEPPDTRLLDALGTEFCLAEGILPWRRIGAATVIATARPDEFFRMRGRLPAGYGPVVMALASERSIHAALVAARQTSLVRRAEARVAAAESCRSLGGRLAGRLALAGLLVPGGLALVSPALAFLPMFFLAVTVLVLCMGLKALAFASEMTARRGVRQAPPPTISRLPVISVMVPLFREDDIAPRLIRRLGRLDYPKELLDILLVAEDDDSQTLSALAARKLPHWMRVVTVPCGTIRTKPRALNYALDFCRGSIVGVWDAEDAPEPGQLRAVAQRFHECGPRVACLQGILDYYNARHNWITRCFTVEYAALFRVVLPGLARLGLVVPLGGTTMFVRRTALESLGAWDAHNVTEDADLGLRLARHGYRTELIPTVTEEEPNSRPWPWIRQRSRWLKGYAITWAVHMRDPVRLWRDLGPKRFLGVQITFLCTVLQFVLAPFLWSFWALILGFGHPTAGVLPGWALPALAALFLASELVNIAVGLWAVRGPGHRHLMKWVPTLHVYYLLGALAAYKALWEVLRRPFFWDKTAHGVLSAAEGEAEPDAAEAPLPVLRLENPILPPVVRAAPDPDRPRLTAPLIWAGPGPELVPLTARPSALPVRLAAQRPGIELQTSFEGF